MGAINDNHDKIMKNVLIILRIHSGLLSSNQVKNIQFLSIIP